MLGSQDRVFKRPTAGVTKPKREVPPLVVPPRSSENERRSAFSMSCYFWPIHELAATRLASPVRQRTHHQRRVGDRVRLPVGEQRHPRRLLARGLHVLLPG